MADNHIQRPLARAKEPGVQEATKASKLQAGATAELRLATAPGAGEREDPGTPARHLGRVAGTTTRPWQPLGQAQVLIPGSLEV